MAKDCDILKAMDAFLADKSGSMGSYLAEMANYVKYQVSQMYNDFYQQLQSQPPYVLEIADGTISSVYELFQRYLTMLDELASAAQSYDNTKVSYLKDEITTLIDTLNEEQLNCREALLKSWGPTNHSGINLLLSLINSAVEGSQDSTILMKAVAEQIYIQQKMSSEQDDTLYGKLLADFNQRYLAVLNYYYQTYYYQIGANEAYTFADSLLKLAVEYETIDVSNQLTRHSDAVLPLVDIIMDVETKVGAGLVKVDFLTYLYSTLNDYITETMKSIPQPPAAKDNQKTSFGINELAYIPDKEIDTTYMFAALNLLKGVVDEYQTNLLNGTFQYLNQKLSQAYEYYKQIVAYFEDLADKEGKIVCVNCSTYNVSTAKRCSSCGALLINPADTMEQASLNMVVGNDSQKDKDEIEMTENVNELFVAADEYYKERKSLEDYKTVLEKFRQNYKTVVETGGVDNEDYKIALEFIRQGLEFFDKLCTSRDLEVLEDGKAHIWHATGILQKLQKSLASEEVTDFEPGSQGESDISISLQSQML